MYKHPPARAGDEAIEFPVVKLQIIFPVDPFRQYILPSLQPKKTIPPATAGDDCMPNPID
jgi:hypothetical protein